MFKWTNHLAFPSLLITCAGLLALTSWNCSWNSRVRDTQVGCFSLIFVCVHLARSLGSSGLFSVIEWAERLVVVPSVVSMINVWTFFVFIFCVRKLIATFDKWELWISCRGSRCRGVSVHASQHAVPFCLGLFNVLEPRLREQVAWGSEINSSLENCRVCSKYIIGQC